jgi:hypothetical protein
LPAAPDAFAYTNIRAPSTSARLESNRGSLTSSAIEAEARGRLTRTEARTPVISRLVDTFHALRPHAQSATDAFESRRATSPESEAGNDASGQPALTASPERWSANLISCGWRLPPVPRGFPEPPVSPDFAAHGDSLIADGRVPINIEYSLLRRVRRAAD